MLPPDVVLLLVLHTHACVWSPEGTVLCTRLHRATQRQTISKALPPAKYVYHSYCWPCYDHVLILYHYFLTFNIIFNIWFFFTYSLPKKSRKICSNCEFYATFTSTTYFVMVFIMIWWLKLFCYNVTMFLK